LISAKFLVAAMACGRKDAGYSHRRYQAYSNTL